MELRGCLQDLPYFSLLSKNIKIKIYSNIIFPAVLYGCETWSVTLTENYGLKVFENRALRKTFGRKRDEVIEEWRRLHNEEIHDLCYSPVIFRVTKSRRRWAGHVAGMEDRRGA
jgi:hypothetical protein